MLGAGSWHKNILEHGLVFDWSHSAPFRYCEPNNKSATANLSQLRTTVLEWETGGFIKRVSDQPFCCNPMTVAVQPNLQTGVTKYRPCIDLSRHVNKFITPCPAKLDDLTVVEELVVPNDFMVALDLENQFFQIRLHPSMSQFLGFMVPDVDGTPMFFQFSVMPYGCKPAVAVVTKMLKPLKSYFHKLGIRFSVYVDDGRICAETAASCDRQLQFVLDILQRVGWRIQWKKTVLVPTQQLLHLGFLIDSVAMRYSLPLAKWDRVRLCVIAVLDLAISGSMVPVRDLATLAGRAVALRRSHGLVVSLLTRSLQQQLGAHVFHHGWSGALLLSPSSMRELAVFLTLVPAFNGRTIPTMASGCHTYDFSAQRFGVAGSLDLSSFPSLPSYALLADGSWSIFPVAERLGPFIQELHSLTFVLQRDRLRLSQAAVRRVYWLSASQSLVILLSRGALSPVLQDLILNIRRLERDMDVHLTAVYVPFRPTPTLLLGLANRLTFSTDEWAVRRSDLAAIFAALQFLPDLDCFASHLNSVCADFFSLQPCPGSLGIDYFAQSVPLGRRLFLCPPVRLISRVFRSLLTLPPDVSFLLLVPDWPSTAYWSILHPGGTRHPIFTAVLQFYPRFFATCDAPCLFTSGARVPFLALCHI